MASSCCWDLPFHWLFRLAWAAIEVVYAIINGFVTLSLFRRDDEKARQARAVLENMGLAKAMLNAPPFLGVVERIFASAIQIGFTLLLAWQPLVSKEQEHECQNNWYKRP